MTQYSYLDYAIEAEDNQAAGSSSVTRFPEGWAGNRVNNAMAAMASALRNLGRRTLFAPIDGSGAVVSQQAGTLALQNAASINVTGGVLAGTRGAVPIGTVIFYGFGFSTYQANFTSFYLAGWMICDGRTIVNPLTGANITVPNFIGRYPFCASTDALSTPGTFTQPTSAAGAHAHGGFVGVAGAHSHGGATAGHALTSAQVPTDDLINFTISGGGGGAGTGSTLINRTFGGGQEHSHGIAADGNHQHGIGSDGSHAHTVTVQPPSVHLIPLIRAF